MTIGTGKDIGQDAIYTHQHDVSVGGETYQLGYYPLENSNIWLLDAAEPSQPFSSSVYRKLATKAIEIISQKKRTPVIIGGRNNFV